MTAPAVLPLPDATRCPDCRAVLTGPSSCAACGLSLSGPAAGRLWEVDVELLRLDAARGELLRERSALLAQLRTTDRAAYAVTVTPAPVPVAPPPPPREWTPQRVQNLLLTLGGLLLAVAALVFAAVTYDRLGAGGRALVLAALTALAAAALPRLHARGLRATAETVGAVTLVLAALDAYGLRTLGLGDGVDGLSYAAASAAVLAGLAAAGARVVPLRVLQGAAPLLAQLPLPLLLAAQDASAATAGLLLAAQAAAGLAVLAAVRLPRTGGTALAAGAAATLAFSLLLSADAALRLSPGPGAVALLAGAAVLAGASALVRDAAGRAALSAAAVGVAGLAAYALVRDDARTWPLVLAAVAVLAALGAAQLPRDRRPGPVLGALGVAAGALTGVAGAAASAVLPLLWLADPWSLPAGRGLRGALAPLTSWDGTLVVPVVVLAAAVTAATAGLALHRERLAAAPAAVLCAAALVLLPLGLDLPYAAGLGLLLALGTAVGAGGVVLLPRAEAAGAVVAGSALLLLAAAWSTAAQGASLVVLPLVAVLVAALAAAPLPRREVAVAGAGLLGAAALAAHGAARGLSAEQVGGLLAVAVAALLGAALLLDTARRTGAETAAAVVGAAAVVLASGDTGWLSWTLAALGLAALATALRADRRAAAPAGALLLSASSWVRLADAGVTAPEPYVLPLAGLALLLGHLRRRQVPGTRSWAAYGPGLLLALVPSLLVSLDDSSLVRPLLVAVAALAVLLVGARTALQAPLVVGGAVLAVDALRLLAPYAAALPRWLSLGAAGVLLVAVGATYEQRRRDVARLRERYDALA